MKYLDKKTIFLYRLFALSLCFYRTFCLKTALLFSGAVLSVLLFVGCTTKVPSGWHVNSSEAALPLMERITLAAARCWFQSSDEGFNPYRLAPELNSFTDRPRLLLVPRQSPTDRPLLVIEANGNPARLLAYGPLMQGKTGHRITRDLAKWAAADNMTAQNNACR